MSIIETAIMSLFDLFGVLIISNKISVAFISSTVICFIIRCSGLTRISVSSADISPSPVNML